MPQLPQDEVRTLCTETGHIGQNGLPFQQRFPGRFQNGMGPVIQTLADVAKQHVHETNKNNETCNYTDQNDRNCSNKRPLAGNTSHAICSGSCHSPARLSSHARAWLITFDLDANDNH